MGLAATVVERPPQKTSHGVCPICFAVYYSPQLLRLAEPQDRI